MYAAHWINRRNLHQHGAEVFNRIYKLMNERGYVYFANYGTLLGVTREQGYIEGDDDIDFAISAGGARPEDLIELFADAPDFKFWYGFEWNGRITELTFSCLEVHVDFFFQYIEDGVNYSHWYDPVDGRWFDAEGFRFPFRRPIPIAKDVRDITVNGCVIPVPSNADEILTSCYGDWRTPVDKDRRLDYEDVRPPKVRLPGRGRMIYDPDEICKISRSVQAQK